jgi:excisionase family DNA binding protein
MTAIETEVLTPGEACALLGICRATLDKYTKNGTIPVIRLGRKVLYRRDDLLALAKREQPDSTMEHHRARKEACQRGSRKQPITFYRT